MSTLSDAFALRASDVGLRLPPELSSRLGLYLDLLTIWNRRVNLTGFDLDAPSLEAIDRLCVEPLVTARALASMSPEAPRLIDLGSGGGSPAIPLALGLGAARLTMVESRGRKATFLREALRAVGLAGEALGVRIEDVGAEHAGAYDLGTVRAVRIDTAVVGRLGSFLRDGGIAVVFTSRDQFTAVEAVIRPPLTHVRRIELPVSASPTIVIAARTSEGPDVSRETSNPS